MIKLACSEEVLGSGMVLFFQNPSTKDFVLAVDGIDNDQFISWHGIREGMVGYPTCINHLDMWLNNHYQHNELEGLASYKGETFDEWDYKEREILQKFASWQQEAVFGRISVNGDVLQFVNPSGDIKSSRNIVEHLLQKGFVDETTRLFINNTDFGQVGTFLRAKGEEKVLISAILIQAAKHDNQLASLAKQFQDITSNAEAANITPDEVQLNEIRSQAMNMIYDDHIALIINNIKNIAKKYRSGEDQNPIEYLLTPVLMRVTDSFLANYNPSLGQVNTKIGSDVAGIAWNVIRDERRQRADFPLAPSYTTEDAYEGSEKDYIDPVGSGVNTYTKMRTPEVEYTPDPRYKAIFEDYGTQMAQSLSPDEMFLVEQRILNGRTLDDIGNELGLTRERIRQKMELIFDKLKIVFKQLNPNPDKPQNPNDIQGGNESIMSQGSKKIILSLPEN